MLSQLVRKQPRKRYLGTLSKKEYAAKLRAAKKKLLAMSEKQLDTFIAKEYPKRLRAYNSSEWCIGTLNTNEVGVWRGAGGLPRVWTNTSLAQTAKKVKEEISADNKTIAKRSKHAIGPMLVHLPVIKKEKYLLPIAFKGGTGTNGRLRLTHKTAWDLDDGNMRSVALAVRGAKTIKAYIGIPKKNN